jgi:hypothetical protein
MGVKGLISAETAPFERLLLERAMGASASLPDALAARELGCVYIEDSPEAAMAAPRLPGTGASAAEARDAAEAARTISALAGKCTTEGVFSGGGRGVASGRRVMGTLMLRVASISSNCRGLCPSENDVLLLSGVTIAAASLAACAPDPFM